jgi:hypothetical protein
MAGTLEGQQQGPGTPRRGLGPALQPSGCSEAAEQLTLMGVGYSPLVLAHSLTRERLMEQIHGEVS